MTGENTAISGWQPDALADGRLEAYRAAVTGGDVIADASAHRAGLWRTLLDRIAGSADGDLKALQERVNRQAVDIGMAFRLVGEPEERPWPLNPIPLLIDGQEWATIRQGLIQRAELLEAIVADIYGPRLLVASGALPAPVVGGSPHFWPQLAGRQGTRGHHLQVYAVDLGRGPDGEWRVLADHCRMPPGAGYALENRLAMARATGNLLSGLNVERLAGFFMAFRAGFAATCARASPRIALLTPGRFSPSYAEQAHLARYLGFLLVEGNDLAVRDDQLYVRTIEGLKRIDGLWRRIDTAMIDPLRFDARSAIGVPGLADAIAAGTVAVANALGAGVAESPALAAFLPALARELSGAPLLLPNIATWWCGQPAECASVRDALDRMLIGPAFGAPVAGLPDGRAVLGASLDAPARAALLAHIERRPQDYVGQEIVHLSTMPACIDGVLSPRPFTLRVFAARDASGAWQVMPGGFARMAQDHDIRAALMGEGAMSADVCVIADGPAEPVTLLPPDLQPQIRRRSGTLPSRAADNLFWLARYLERGEMLLRVIRALLGGSLDVNGGADLSPETIARLTGLLVAWGAVPATDAPANITTLCRQALEDTGQRWSVRALIATARTIGQGLRERLSTDVWRLLDRDFASLATDNTSAILHRATLQLSGFAAISGLTSENMGRSPAWRFLDLGRRIERAIATGRVIRNLGGQDAQADDLGVLLDLCDSQISYRARYMLGLSLLPVRDLVGLEPENPRSLAFQIARIGEHLTALPALQDDGMPEETQRLSNALTAEILTTSARSLHAEMLLGLENQLLALSDAIGRRYFLQGGGLERATGTLRLA